VVLKLSPYGRKYQLFEDIFNIDFPLCKKILLLGIPIGVQFSAEIMAMTIATYFLGEFGVDALAASQIVGQYAVIIIMIILGFSQALALLISRDFHNNNVSHVKHYFWAAILPLGLCLVVIGYFFIGHPILLMRLFVTTNLANHVEIYYLGTAFFAIAFAFLTIDSLRNLLSGALRGMHDSKTPMRIGVLCLWFISLPFCYVVGFWLHGGPIGLRLSFILGFALACFWLWVRLQKRITESSLNPIFNL